MRCADGETVGGSVNLKGGYGGNESPYDGGDGGHSVVSPGYLATTYLSRLSKLLLADFDIYNSVLMARDLLTDYSCKNTLIIDQTNDIMW